MKTLIALVGLLAAGAVGFTLVGCGSENAVSLGKPGSGAATTTAPEQTGTQKSNVSLEVWFSRDKGLVAVRRAHAPTQLVATAAMNALLAGPTAAERSAGLSSAVPPGTRLLGIAIHDGLATVDLTSEYQSGGGALSMQTRLGQVVYTLTQFPTVEKVRFRLDGEPVNVFSSEGIVLKNPVGRTDYAALLPAITVDKPAAGDRVTSPVTVSGSANVFEANVTVEVLDANGKVVGKTFTTATCGTGCRGTYSVEVTYKVAKEQAGHDRGARRRRGRHGHAAAFGADPGHAGVVSQRSSSASASSSRDVSPHAPSSSSVPVWRSKRGSARPTTWSPARTGRT